jgi:integrase
VPDDLGVLAFLAHSWHTQDREDGVVRRSNSERPTTWKGGFIRYNARGEKVFVLQQMEDGVRWKKTLGVITEDAALAERARFQENPEAFCSDRPAEPAQEEDEPIYLDAALVTAYMRHASAPKEDNGRENSQKWMNEKKHLLMWWAEKLVDGEGRTLDLRRVKLAKHVLPVLEPEKGKRHKREAVKALYGWLRKTGQITTAEDPVMSLPVGQGRVAQTEGGKNKVVPREHVLRVAEHLQNKGSRYGHALVIQAATGWHVTEVARFIAGGEIVKPVPRHLQEPGVTAILMGPRHKNGRKHFAKIGERAEFSAGVLLDQRFGLDGPDGTDGRSGFHRGTGKEVGGISIRHYVIAIHDACDALQIPRFSPAWMRHTNATHALQQAGVTPEDAGKFLGHADGLMAGTVYGPNAVPPKVPTIVDDPLSSPAPRQHRRTG